MAQAELNPRDRSVDNALAEWKTARKVIGDTDGRLASLRQYGISFVASLLTAEGLIDTVPATAAYIPPQVKLAIVIASLVLISALFTTERNLRTIQRAAALRARVLERTLDMELTESISTFYKIHHTSDLVDSLYYFLIGATGLLGFFVLNPTTVSFDPSTIVEVFATVLSWAFVAAVRLSSSDFVLDWSLNKYRIKAGEVFEATLINFTRRPVTFVPGWCLFRLRDAAGSSFCEHRWSETEDVVRPGESRTWPCRTAELAPGSYYFEFAPMLSVGRCQRRPPDTEEGFGKRARLPRPIEIYWIR